MLLRCFVQWCVTGAGRSGNFPDDLLRVLLTAFDSRGKNILSDSSSSSGSSDTSSTPSNSELHSQTSHTSHTGSKSSSRASNSDVSSEGPFGEVRSSEGVEYDAEGNVAEPQRPKRPKKRSKRIKSRTQNPTAANGDADNSTVHMLENLAAAAGGVSSGRIALAQVLYWL